MANVRPKRTGNERVNNFDFQPPEAPPSVNREERPESFFKNDYDNMFPGSFTRMSEGIRGPSGCSLETLVATLATLHFTTKGKVGEDGKFELIFCSPEPVVSEVKTPVETVHKDQALREPDQQIPRDAYAPRVRFIESTPHRKRHKHRSSTWFTT